MPSSACAVPTADPKSEPHPVTKPNSSATCTARITHLGVPGTPNRFGVVDHIEVHAEDHQRLPITETGYRSHWVYEDQLEPYGSALAFVQAWLDTEASKPAWRAYLEASRQMNLF